MTMSVNKKSNVHFLIYFRNAELTFLYLFPANSTYFLSSSWGKTIFLARNNKAYRGWSKAITLFAKTLACQLFLHGNSDFGSGPNPVAHGADFTISFSGNISGYQESLVGNDFLSAQIRPEENLFHPQHCGYPGQNIQVFLSPKLGRSLGLFPAKRAISGGNPRFCFPPANGNFSRKHLCAPEYLMAHN